VAGGRRFSPIPFNESFSPELNAQFSRLERRTFFARTKVLTGGFSHSFMSSVVSCYSGNTPLITIPFPFFIVLKLLSMIVIFLIGVPAAAAICFRLLLPLFTVDMPCRHVEPESFV
jgi:hypothetical protein